MENINRIQSPVIKHENELANELSKAHYESCRLPGKSTKTPDFIVGNGESVFSIAVKITTRNQIKFKAEEIKALIRFSWKFQTEPWVAAKFIDRTQWLFLRPHALEISEDNKIVSIQYAKAIMKGLSVKEVISNELQKRII
jgi:Holliday junction resolvase